MKNVLLYIILIVFASSCSVQKFLPEGEKLYRGADIEVKKHPDVNTKEKELKTMLKVAAKPRPNKFLLGQPWKVWWWYTIGEPRRPRGLKNFLRNRLGEEPVLSSRVNTKSTSENMASLLQNNGYFFSGVTGDTVNKGYLTKAIYKADVQPQYTIGDIEWVVTDTTSDVMKELTSDGAQKQTILKKGNPYVLDVIKSERSRLDIYLKTLGYYYFNPDYLMAYVDSTVGNRSVKLFFNLKNTAPEFALHPYNIRSILVFPNYSLATPTLDTSRANAKQFEGIFIRDTLNNFKPILFRRTITYKEGDTYSSRDHNATLNRFINLSAFKFVKNSFERTADSSYSLNSTYYLTPAPKKSLQAQLDGFYKDNNYMGSEVSVNFRNRNAFKGAEQLQVRAYGGFETATAHQLQRNNNYRLGANASLRVPRYVVPFFDIKENNFYQPFTNMSLGFEWFRKNLLYTRNNFNVQYDFTWKPTYQKSYTWAPLSVTYIRSANVTDSMWKVVAANPMLANTIYSEAIIGQFIQYSYNTANPQAVNRFFYGAGVDVSGNILGLVTGAKNWREKYIFGTPFAQYIKGDVRFHYTRRLPNKWDWANRIDIGVGYPYGNSRIMPMVKQYVIGGASTIRGFNSRGLGPGSYRPSVKDQQYYQIIGGDMRLLLNTELRIPLSNMFGVAGFIDAGNIWNMHAVTTDNTMNGPQAKFSKDFMKEIAVATGVGLRVDLSFLLLRVDLGIPLRKPFLPAKERWVLNQFDPGSKEWRRENLILNIAIGLPF